MLVGLRRPPPVAELAALPGVAPSSASEPTLFRVQFAGRARPDAMRSSRARWSENWGLYQLAPAQTSLEDVFVNLTRREDAVT